AGELGKPQRPVRGGGDAARVDVGCGNGELGDGAGGRHAPDLVGELLGEPQIAVDTCRNGAWSAGFSRRGEFLNCTLRSDSSDLRRAEFGEPHVAVWSQS